jgi:hypothetical protein
VATKAQNFCSQKWTLGIHREKLGKNPQVPSWQ